VGGTRGRSLCTGIAVGLGEHDDERVWSSHLCAQCVKGAPEMVAAVVHDEDGGDSGEHRGKPKRASPSHPESAWARHETGRPRHGPPDRGVGGCGEPACSVRRALMLAPDWN
jgi:hypothetical protein